MKCYLIVLCLEMSKSRPDKRTQDANINWAQFGLATDDSNYQTQTNHGSDIISDDYLMQGGVPHQNELFRENQV